MVLNKIYHCCTFSILITIIACNKEANNETEKQGSNFNTLLKTVAENITGNGLTITTNFFYNANGQVTQIKRVFNSHSGNPTIQEDTYYRNAAGRLDSITYINTTDPQSPGFYNFYKTEFRYNLNGNIAYTINKSNNTSFHIDSAVYSYQANRVSQRVVYRRPANAASFVLTVSFIYTYDASGNLSAMDALWSSPNNSSRNCIYTYDNKSNPLPVMEYENELYGNWIKAFDNTFSTSNNILSRRCPQGWDWDWGNKDFEYRYSANNKPIYQKVKHTDSPGFYEVKYYYD